MEERDVLGGYVKGGTVVLQATVVKDTRPWLTGGGGWWTDCTWSRWVEETTTAMGRGCMLW